MAHHAIDSRQKHEQHDREVAALVARFKACPDRNTVPQGCYEASKRNAVYEAAETNFKTGKYDEAGVGYAKIGMRREATQMAEICAKVGNEEGKERIVEMLSAYAEALARYADGP
jgi:hypothetical protein